ncbi:MAG: hypothetical protein ACTH31_07055 [Pseudoclavibacter sp.]
MRGVIHRLLFLMPFVFPIWMLVWWLVNGASAAEFFFLLIAMPASFVTAAIAGLVVWLRPDVRERREVAWSDAAWLGGAWLAWLVAGAIGGGFGTLALIGAGVIAVAAISWLWRRLRIETTRSFEALADEAARVREANGDAAGARKTGAPGPGPTGGSAGGGARQHRPSGTARRPAEGPDAGKVITLEPSPRADDES